MSAGHFRTAEPRLHVHDLRAALQFYVEVLGCEVTTLFPPAAPTFAMLRRDRVCIQLGGIGGQRAASDRSTCTLWFDVHDVRGLHGELADKTAIAWGPEVYFYGRREFAVRDLDGNLLVFSEETADPPTCKQ